MHNYLRQTLLVGAGALLALSVGSCTEMDEQTLSPRSNLEEQCTDGPCDSVTVITLESCVDTSMVDLCRAQHVSFTYLGGLDGITNITVAPKFMNHCGFVATYGPAIIGEQLDFQVTELEGTPEDVGVGLSIGRQW